MIYEVKSLYLYDVLLEKNPEIESYLKDGWEPFSVVVAPNVLATKGILYLRRAKEQEKVPATSWEL